MVDAERGHELFLCAYLLVRLFGPSFDLFGLERLAGICARRTRYRPSFGRVMDVVIQKVLRFPPRFLSYLVKLFRIHGSAFPFRRISVFPAYIAVVRPYI